MDQREERKKFIEKQFNLAEVPIRNWLLKCCTMLNVNGQVDSTDEFTDCVLTEHNDVYYAISLKFGNQKRFFDVISKEKFVSSDKLKEAVGMIFNAVNMVYMSVHKTLIINSDMLDHVFPKFDNEELSFSLVAANPHVIEKSIMEKHIAALTREIEKVAATLSSTAHLQEQRLKYMAAYNAITDEVIMKSQAESEQKTERLRILPKLYVCIEQFRDTEEHVDLLSRRLDIFSTQYEDID